MVSKGCPWRAVFLAAAVFASCGGREPGAVLPRAVYELDRVYIDGRQAGAAENGYAGSRIIFVGPENGGNVIIWIGDAHVQASINPSRDHPSFEAGYWHFHLYSGPAAAGSPRINLMEAFGRLGICDNGETDSTQSAFQRGSLHYVVQTGEFRLRFTIGSAVHDLMFGQV